MTLTFCLCGMMSFIIFVPIITVPLCGYMLTCGKRERERERKKEREAILLMIPLYLPPVDDASHLVTVKNGEKRERMMYNLPLLSFRSIDACYDIL